MPAVDSQEADKDSLNVVQKAGFRGHWEKAKEATEAQPLVTGSAGHTKSGPWGPSLLSFF